MTTIIIPRTSASVNVNTYLDPKTRELYRAITNLCKRLGHAWITNAALAKEYGKSVATAKRYVSRLCRLGLIRIEIDCSNVYQKRRIFCLVPLAALRPGGFVLSNPDTDSRDVLTPTPADSLPYIEIPEDSNQQDTTPLPLPDPTPCPSVVVIPDSVHEEEETAESYLQKMPLSANSPILFSQTENSTPAASVPSPPIPTANHPHLDADTAEIISSLESEGIRPHAVAVQLATDFPDRCRLHLAAFRPELHTKNPAGHLRRAIQEDWTVDPPTPAPKKKWFVVPPRTANNRQLSACRTGQDGATLLCERGSDGSGTADADIGNMRGALASKFRRYQGAIGG